MRPYYSGSDIKIFNGDCIDVLRGMDAESIDMCITSPPYWGLRDYGTAEWEGGNSDCNHSQAKEKSRYDYDLSKAQTGTHSGAKMGTDQAKWKDKCPSCGAIKKDSQLGLEPTYQEYINKLIAIFDEVKRVLKDTGTCWVNLGDSYGGCQGRGDGKGNEYSQKVTQSMNIMAKSLIGIPERFAISMTDAGWIRRNTIIWYKPNCMPSSAGDRFTVDFEYLYFFTKKTKYWFEQQFQPYAESSFDRYKYNVADHNVSEDKRKDGWVTTKNREERKKVDMNPSGANKRCVWKIPTQSYSDAHFATYPEELVYTPIKAGCPQYICKKCGKARETIFVLSNCGCNAGFKGGTVLDPFMGSGTTLKVARELGRNGIGIELNPEYIKMALKRINVSQELLKI